MAVILPLKLIYHAHGFPVHYVGHPLKDTVKMGIPVPGQGAISASETKITIGFVAGKPTAEANSFARNDRSRSDHLEKIPAQYILCLGDTLDEETVTTMVAKSESMSKRPRTDL